jgi:hypothetical protein
VAHKESDDRISKHIDESTDIVHWLTILHCGWPSLSVSQLVSDCVHGFHVCLVFFSYDEIL